MDACRRRVQTAVLTLGVLVVVGTFATFLAGASAARIPSTPVRSTIQATGSIAVPPTELFRQGLVVPMGSGADSLEAGKPTVLHEGGLYKMWYFGCTPTYNCTIDYATSLDGHAWAKYGVVLAPAGTLEQLIGYPAVVKAGSTYWLYYNGYDYSTYRIFAATSPDGVNWTRHGLVLDVGLAGSLDAQSVLYPNVLYNGTGFTMWYTGRDSPTPPNTWILRASSTDGLTWTKDGLALPQGPAGSSDAFGVCCGYVQRLGSLYEMLYTGELNASTYYIMYAQSTDGVSWTKLGIALTAVPGLENQIVQPSFLIEANQSWSVWYGVRNGGSDISIYLAVSDTEPPRTTATLMGTLGLAGWYTSDVAVHLSARDNLSGVAGTTYSLDSGPVTAYTGNLTITDGTHVLTFQSTDRVGNAEANHTLELRVDTIAPVSSAGVQGTLGDQSWYTSDVHVVLTATDGGSGVAGIRFSLDGGPLQNYTAPFTLSQGIHLVVHQATDLAGNIENLSLTFIKVDTTPPAVTVQAPVHSTQATVQASWSGSGGLSGVDGYEVSVDGGAYQPVGMNTSATLTLGDGAHTIRVRVTDAAGKSATAAANVSVDTNAFSFSGPYSGLPTVGIIAVAAALAAFVIWRRRKKQPQMAPPPPTSPPQG